MYRIRLQLPKRHLADYHHLDLLHDALVNAWTEAGAKTNQILGVDAKPWTFAALGGRRNGRIGYTHTLVISTPDPQLTMFLQRFSPEWVRYARANTQELVDFATADITIEPDPIPPGNSVLSCLMLSPLAISSRHGDGRRWHRHLGELDLAAAINARLSRIANREVHLQAQPDALYIRANPNHSVLVSLKRFPNGRHAFVIGMQAPIVLMGNEDDLRLAWYAGIGEKTRNGFGCLGLLERGVGR